MTTAAPAPTAPGWAGTSPTAPRSPEGDGPGSPASPSSTRSGPVAWTGRARSPTTTVREEPPRPTSNTTPTGIAPASPPHPAPIAVQCSTIRPRTLRSLRTSWSSNSDGCGAAARPSLLDADDHRVRTDQMLHARRGEAGLLQPAGAVGARVVEAARSLDEHVQAHHEAERVLAPVVVDDRFVDHERAAAREGVERLLDEHLLRRQVPVVEDVSHQHDVGLRERLLEEVARYERDAIREAGRHHVLLEDRRHLGQVEPDAAQVRVGERDLRGEVALSRADVHER